MTVYLDFDGKPMPANDLSWFEVAPCGCLIGATIVEHYDGALTTPEMAWASFHEGDTKPKIKQDQERGYTVRLGLKAEVRQMTSDCEHTPRWGYEPAPTPSGWKWQAPNHYAMARDRKHLVPAAAAAGSRDGSDFGWGNAECGKNGGWWDRDLGALAECAKCLNAAHLLMTTNEVPF